jgi:formate hydrogenlyase subunit 3/multisubunit Na+/H+ antiporter MnhD subunit
MINAPTLILILTLLAASLVSLLRRHHLVAAGITGIVAASIALIVLFVPINEAFTVFGTPIRIQSEWIILGRSFVVNEANRNAIGYLYLTGGFFLTGSWTVKPVRMFLPLGFGILFLVASSLMIVPFLFAAIFIEIAVIAGLLILTTRKIGSFRGGMRLIIFYTFGMFALLLSGWAVDVGGILSDVSVISERALLLLYFGFSVLLAIPPFHSWIPIASEETHPFAVGFIVLILQAAGLFFFIRFMNAFTWIWDDSQNLAILRAVGAGVAVVGALWAVTQDTITKLGSYAMVSDVGVMLIALGFGTVDGFQIALGLLAARAIGISCWAIGISVLRDHTVLEVDEKKAGMNRWGWLPTVVMISGVISLAGVPLTAGFPARWGLILMSEPKGIHLWIAILFSMTLIGYAGLKQVFKMMSISSSPRIKSIDLMSRVFLLGGLAMNIFLGIFPQVLLPWIRQTVLGFGAISP